ncbi:stage III sporulation protein AF [Fredinandcohnia humi]
MSFIAEWITNIILFILLATIVDMLLPNSSMQKYVKMVTGLLLIVIILTPLFSILTSDFEKTIATLKLSPSQEDKNIENLIEMKKKEIQASSNAYILERMQVQLKNLAEEELVQKEYDLSVQKVLLSIKDESKETVTLDDITSIKVVLSKETADPDDIPVVKPVEIDTSKQNETNDTEMNIPNINKITSLLATKWEIDSEKIVVTVEGGKES